MNFVRDLNKDLRSLDKATLELGSNLNNIRKGSLDASKGVLDLSKALKSTDDFAVKAGKSVKALGAVGFGAAGGLLAVADAGAKLGAIATIADASYRSLLQLSGVSRTLKFEEAILGTNNLTQNFEILENTANTTIDSIRLGFRSIFDAEGFSDFSSRAVAAFAPVEQAAFRLSTITVQSGERSVDALDKNIESMRRLQAATNDALGSVELLNAQYDIASAGFTTPTANLQVGEAAVNLSQAGFGDLAGSTNATVRVLRALGDESDKAGLRASQLFETTRVGLLTLDQLTPVIGGLSVQSKQLGLDFAEITAGVAGLTTQGVSASEAATRLEALFSEITNATPEANKQLAAFRDEAGKPIQLNASTLKEKGLRGVVKDIETATGGDVAKIQGLFSTKEATEAVQLLISLGDKAFAEYTDRIKNVNTSDLGREAGDRVQTITGAFQQAQNSSQRQVEQFGSGFGESVVNEVLSANEAFKTFSTGSAEAIGQIVGSITGLTNKLQAIGGFVSTAFAAVLPFAFFAVISKGIAKIGPLLQQQIRPGETLFQAIQRKALEAYDTIEAKWTVLMSKIKAKAISTAREIKTALESGAAEVTANKTAPIQTDLFGNNVELRSNKSKIKSEDIIPNRINTSGIKSVRNELNLLKQPSSGTQLDFFKQLEQPPKLSGIERVKQSVTGLQTKVTGGFSVISNASKVGFKTLSTGAGFVAPLLKSAGGALLGIGAAGAVAAGALAIGSGWIGTIGTLLNKRTNPALQEMASSLRELKNVEGLSEVLKEFDSATSRIESTSFGVNVLNEALTRSAGLWNQVTGASFALEQQTIPQLERVNKLLDEQIEKNAKNATSGNIGTTTDEGKRAEEKIQRGITLDGTDEAALKNEVKEKQQVISARIANEERIIAEIEKSGSAEAKANLDVKRGQLLTLKQQAEQEKKNLDTALQKKLVEQQINRFKAVDTTIPIQVQLQENAKQGIQAQINEITEILNASEVDILADPETYAAQFSEVSKKLSGTIDAVSVELEFNVTNAQELRQKLIDEVGEDNFNRFIASSPTFRKRVSDLNKGVTQAVSTQAQQEETANTAVLGAAQSLGSESTTVAASKFNAELGSINTQVGALNDELQRPETTLNRQKEIIAEIEQLEAKRVTLNAEAQISKELGARKQQVTLEQEILNVKQATLNIFNQESKFASLSITSAQARVQAAQQELSLKKEQISIEGRENVIKKEAIVDSIEQRDTRSREQGNAGLSGFDLSNPQLNQELQSKANDFSQKQSEESNKQIDIIRNQTNRDKEKITQAAKTFTEEEQKKIADVLATNRSGGNEAKFLGQDFGRRERVRQNTFNEDGTLKIDASEVQKQIKESQNIGNFDTKAKGREANDIFVNKDLESRQKSRDLSKTETESISRIESNAKAAIESRGKIFDAVRKRAEEQATKNTDFSNILGEDRSNRNNNTNSESNSQGEGVTAREDAAFAKAVEAIRNKLGTLSERISLNQAKIELEFAGREKLIRRGELLSESLSNIASKSNLFADSLAGASLQLTATELSNAPERLQKDADEEIAKINQKVKDLAQNAADAQEAVSIAQNAGADAKTISRLQSQANDARNLAQSASSEREGDIEFVRQKTALDQLSASIDMSVAKINLEFVSREKLAKQTNELADGFGQLAGSSLLSGSSAASQLQFLQSSTRANSGQVDTEADRKIAEIEARISTLRELAEQPGEIGNRARQDLNVLEGEAAGDIEAVNTQRAFGKINASLEQSNSAIELEFASRQRSIEINESLTSSFSSVAGTLSSLFSNSSIVASLNKFTAQLNVSNNKAGKEFSRQSALLDERSAQLAQAVQTARESGASDETIKGLEAAQQQDEAQKPLEKAYLRQKAQLDSLNNRLAVMAAEVEEVSDKLSKQADVIKEGIDLEDRRRAAAVENNKSGTQLQSALVGFLGKNNPVAQQLQQRLEIQQARDEARAQQASNVSEAQKEVIDTTVLKSQLELEQRSYENAITQTALLSDLLSVSTGGRATSSAGGEIRAQLNKLPGLLTEGREQAAQRAKLIDDRLSFIPQELESRQVNVRRNLLANELGTLGGNLNPANIDLISRTLSETEREVKNFRRQDIQVGSLQDNRFTEQLRQLGGRTIPAPTRNDLEIDARVRNNLPIANSIASGGGFNINTPISIQIDASGINNTSELEALIKRDTVKTVNQGLDRLSKQVQSYAMNM